MESGIWCLAGPVLAKDAGGKQIRELVNGARSKENQCFKM